MKGIKVLQCKYLNNIVGQDHSAIKQRIVIGCGFKEFESANDFTDLSNYFMHSTPWFRRSETFRDTTSPVPLKIIGHERFFI
ncbi:hypothetical protein PP180_14695 [Muricauda sp. SK9]|uniref:hypothetical protein n=1 Tax=Flagellimonas taeanensis TaxID=1005926 RepID=UPI000E6A251F|nr:hypothetical protein [Allomuricauda taeanensis]MDC6386631.1 hypothetical protein [Muricauda sp. SK9]